MRIKVDQIPEAGMDVAFSRPADHFAVLKQMDSQGQARFFQPVAADVHVRRIGRLIEADVALHTSVQLPCSRCLTMFSLELGSRFSLTYTPRPTAAKADDATPIDDGAQADMFTHDGKEVDLTEGVQEQIVLALPMQPLCDPACKGLCPGCGADLNTQACTCPPAGGAGPFAALKKLTPPE